MSAQRRVRSPNSDLLQFFLPCGRVHLSRCCFACTIARIATISRLVFFLIETLLNFLKNDEFLFTITAKLVNLVFFCYSIDEFFLYVVSK
jgi:hypothetical protein